MTGRRAAMTAALLAAFGLAAMPAAAQPEAADAFGARQDDLVALSAHLGALHRLHQVCHPEESPEQFRRQLMAIITMEIPRGSTRAEMIAAFNGRYRSASRAYAICGRGARRAYAEEADRALIVTERLYAPFR